MISTHILDTHLGKPAAHVLIKLLMKKVPYSVKHLPMQMVESQILV